MPTLPLVSVIVPAYNRADVFGELIDSVLAQTYPNLELVIVDDGSRDGTAALVDSYGDRVVSIRQQNQGLAAARNIGFHRSRGEYVAWADHDDLWNPEKIAVQVELMQRQPDCVLVATDFSAFDETGYFDRSHASEYYSAIARAPGGLNGIFPERLSLSTKELPEAVTVHAGHVYDKMVWGNFLHPPTVMMTRKAALAAGDLEQKFATHVDYEYLIRVSRLGRVAFVDHPLIRYRYSDGQLSSDKNLAKSARSLLMVLEMLCERDGKLRDDPAFQRRIAGVHLQIAHALAEKERGPALRHLLRSLAGRVFEPMTATTLAKLCLPQFIIQGYRERRHLD